jgi:hypothetical protein
VATVNLSAHLDRIAISLSFQSIRSAYYASRMRTNMQQHSLNLRPALGPADTRRASQMRQAARLSSSGPFADQEPDQAEEPPVKAIQHPTTRLWVCATRRARSRPDFVDDLYSVRPQLNEWSDNGEEVKDVAPLRISSTAPKLLDLIRKSLR